MKTLIALLKALFTTLGAFFTGELMGEAKQAQKQSESDLDAITQANNNAGLVDLMSSAQQLQYLQGRGRVRTSQNKPLP